MPTAIRESRPVSSSPEFLVDGHGALGAILANALADAVVCCDPELHQLSRVVDRERNRSLVLAPLSGPEQDPGPGRV